MTHNELLEKVKPIITAMDKEEYNYLIIAGKEAFIVDLDGISSSVLLDIDSVSKLLELKDLLK